MLSIKDEKLSEWLDIFVENKVNFRVLYAAKVVASTLWSNVFIN